MVVVSRIGVNYAHRDASPMRMENQHEGWGGEGYRPFVCLFIYIDMFSSRGGGEAIQCHASVRDRPAIRENGMEKKEEGGREGNYRRSLAIRLWRFITFFN